MNNLQAYAPLLTIVAVILILIGIYIYTVVREKNRKAAMENVATEMGMRFEPFPDQELQYRLATLPLFTQGHGQKTRNVIIGATSSVEIAILDHSYVIGRGRNKTTKDQTVVYIESTDLSLPEIKMHPENVLYRIGTLFGYQDIDFDSHPTFSRLYVLRGPNESAVRNAFRPDVLEFFESHPGLTVEGNGDQLIVYRGRKRIPTGEIRHFLETAFSVYGQLRSV